ncbi:MAG: hypothetical protein ACRENH_14955 [Gemmatimonadaceae bacterium]
MTRFTATRFSALMAALTIGLSACSDTYPVATQFSPGDPAAATTGILTFPGDLGIVDVLASSCGETEIPSSVMHLATWRDDEGVYRIELHAGCYDIRVVRETDEGLVTEEQRGLVISAGDEYVFEADSDA